MTEHEMKNRTRHFALRVITLVKSLPKSQDARVLGNQLLRSGTSVGANYRSACRARSIPDFISKISICEEEADESLFWMELITEAGLISHKRMAEIMKEASELTAIFTASIKTAKQNSKNRSSIRNQSKI